MFTLPSRLLPIIPLAWYSNNTIPHSSTLCLKHQETQPFHRLCYISLPSSTKIRSTGVLFLKRWHRMLNLPRQSPSAEHRIAKTPGLKLSEASDVFFSVSRAQYDGFPIRNLPPFVTSRHSSVYAYMVMKYTLRWAFYRRAAITCARLQITAYGAKWSIQAKAISLKRALHVTRLTLRSSKRWVAGCEEYGLFSRRAMFRATARVGRRNATAQYSYCQCLDASIQFLWRYDLILLEILQHYPIGWQSVTNRGTKKVANMCQMEPRIGSKWISISSPALT